MSSAVNSVFIRAASCGVPLYLYASADTEL